MKFFTGFFLLVIFCNYESFSQINYNFFISNLGKNSNPGTSKSLPRQTIAGTSEMLKNYALSNGKVSIGLESGNVFNETLKPSYSIKVGTYSNSISKNDFAILNGSDVYALGWRKAENSLNTFYQLINYSGFVGFGITNIGRYSFLYVMEIDKELEKKAPYTARKTLILAPRLSAVDSIPGSVYEVQSPPQNQNPIKISIHTSNGISPNSNPKYRYEVAVRDYAVNAYNSNNNVFENLWVRGYGAGNGSLPSGNNSYYNKIIFGPGAPIHHVSAHDGSINNSLFLPGLKNLNEFAVVFYDFEGFIRHNKISNSLFLDIESPIYTHTHGTATNYGCLELNNVFAFADSTGGKRFVSSANTDTVSLNNIYTDKHSSAFYNGSAKYVAVQNSCFKDITNGISFGPFNTQATIDNVFIISKGNINDIGITMQTNTSLKLTNSIIHIKGDNLSSSDKAGYFITGCGNFNNHISATGNIFICDIDVTKILTAAATNTNNGIATSTDGWNNNVYVLLKGKISWAVSNKNTNGGNSTIETFKEWQKQSGQDKNSLFFDLRNDPRGLKAVFIDPENGNYELANTVEGNQIRELKAGMTTPISCFLKKPTYEEAAEMIKNEKIMRINSCRSECQKSDVRLRYSYSAGPDVNPPICQDQDIHFKGSGYYNQNDLAYHQSDNTSRYLWWFSDKTDTSGVNLNSVTHKFNNVGQTAIRLQMIDINGCSFDTILKEMVRPAPIVKLGSDTTICAVSNLTLSVNHPGFTYLWNTGSTGNSINISNTGLYWVRATMNGCSFKDSLELKVEKCPCTFQMPNSFSPNNDGINDTYSPIFGCPPLTYNLSVFNRLGQLVFKTTDYKTKWDGSLNGKPLPFGVYVYVLNFTNEKFKDTKPILGSITLLQ